MKTGRSVRGLHAARVFGRWTGELDLLTLIKSTRGRLTAWHRLLDFRPAWLALLDTLRVDTERDSGEHVIG